MIAVDYVGIATLITAFGAAIASVLAVVFGRAPHNQTADIHAAVTTSNGTTLAGVVEKIDRATEAIEEPPKS